MSRGFAGSVAERDLRRLHLAIEPAAAYAVLWELAAGLLGARPLGAYLREEGGFFAIDPDAGPSDLPARWHPEEAPLPAGLVPVVYHYRDRPLGALVFTEDRALDPVAIREHLDTDFAPALFRAAWLSQTLEECSRSREQLRFLREMGALLGNLDLEPLLVNVLDLTCGFLGAGIGSVIIQEDDGTLRMAVDWGLPLDVLRDLSLEDGSPVLERTLHGAEPLLLGRAALCSPAGPARLPDRLLLLPLRTRSGVVGCLALAGEEGSPGMSPAALQIVRPAVGLAATAIENARLFRIKLAREKEHQQLALARQIQAGLLPSAPPPVEGIELAASSVSATMIGGDYFDYFILPDGSLGLLVADVAGKGVAAGLIMTAARATFRAAALEHCDPAVILSRVNRTLAAENFNGRFVTAILAHVDLDAGEIVLSSAAHEPLMIRRAATGRVERVGAPALPLGVLPEATYADLRTPVLPGDAFILYTDGVTEAMSPAHRLLGSQALAETLEAAGDLGADGLLQSILDRVAAHIGPGPRSDDTTLIAARVQPHRNLLAE